VGRLINKVTLSLYDHAVSGVARRTKDWAIGVAPRLADGVVVQTRRAGRTAASAALLKCGHSGAMPALNRLTLVAVLSAERYLMYQAAH
jgi:hypothetical protein